MRGSIRIFELDVAVLEYVFPEWPALSHDEKYLLLKSVRDEPDREIENVTCVDLHRWIAQVINPEKSIDDEIATVHLGDGGTSTSASDTSLNNKVAAIDLADAEYDETVPESHFNFFVDSSQANGHTLNELAIVSADGRFANHAAISPDVSKTNAKTLVIEVIIDVS